MSNPIKCNSSESEELIEIINHFEGDDYILVESIEMGTNIVTRRISPGSPLSIIEATCITIVCIAPRLYYTQESRRLTKYIYDGEIYLVLQNWIKSKLRESKLDKILN